MHDDLQTMASSDGVSVHTGFPNPALEHRGGGAPLAVDLNRYLVQRPSSTFLFRIAGHHWADQGIYDGDVAIIDRAMQAKPTDFIITWRDTGAAIVKQHQLVDEDRPWGVVTAIIHQYHPR